MISILWWGLAVWCLFMLADEIRERDWVGAFLGLVTTTAAIGCAIAAS